MNNRNFAAVNAEITANLAKPRQAVTTTQTTMVPIDTEKVERFIREITARAEDAKRRTPLEAAKIQNALDTLATALRNDEARLE